VIRSLKKYAPLLLVAIVSSLLTSVLVVNYVYPDSAQASSAPVTLAAAQGADLAAAPAATSTDVSTRKPCSGLAPACGYPSLKSFSGRCSAQDSKVE